MSIYIATISCDPSVAEKLNTKHQLTFEDLRQALCYPARVEAAFDDDPEHGPRWIALATTVDDRHLLAALLPLPSYDGENAEIWLVKTAYFLD